MHVLDELTRIAERNDGIFKFHRHAAGLCTASFKASGIPFRKVGYDYPKGCLRELLKTLEPVRAALVVAEGIREVDNDEMLSRATPRQMEQIRKLLDQLRELRREILHPTPIDVLEPTLASPRSSLNPQFTQGEPATSEDGTRRNDNMRPCNLSGPRMKVFA